MRKLTKEEMDAVSGGEGCYWDVYGNFLYCDPPPGGGGGGGGGCQPYYDMYTGTYHC
ncbi:MAG TPA: hypothetical protein VFS47_10805 [Steroidobacteraceae bacterium]|nr:hypothetical protein [Steroidobacteraceae bacterium]